MPLFLANRSYQRVKYGCTIFIRTMWNSLNVCHVGICEPTNLHQVANNCKRMERKEKTKFAVWEMKTRNRTEGNNGNCHIPRDRLYGHMLDAILAKTRSIVQTVPIICIHLCRIAIPSFSSDLPFTYRIQIKL